MGSFSFDKMTVDKMTMDRDGAGNAMAFGADRALVRDRARRHALFASASDNRTYAP